MTEHGMKWELLGQHLVMLPQKALYWDEERALIVADLHIGKVGHFRKAGIAIPRPLEQEELAVLADLIHILKPEKLIFLGDLFHSEFNNDWNWLQLWRELFADVKIILVRGNHDILHDEYYNEAGFEVCEKLDLNPFVFTHEPVSKPDGNEYIISGHVHPAVRLRGKGRQTTVLSCFYFGRTQAILPAFGRFTGNCCISIDELAATFVVVNDKVIKL
ncbi:putative phosphoesterase [Arcticibacter tournemirensis]|uniref:Ligase-associated DNA damage response endonuclease PdeM n=1 Tax=Arcticibacter tournemirensis TaxID=699437 RepID=A0A4Q0MEJ7_9SPHI|nr:ligase-associated DNA damage response endonuclease PdeM [Arcticibacter tournemirensis]KAA8481399.1 ligase-associated DNA damage response endonuclease PdeM [Arcticibacter tournemirensis]RXF71593.1 ligase-associated DNA damage response endonuclease PdeM [Arcticibacter tournemirensis]TQM48982.1 putative phosphoesterase [Arcticibacter tournemirensis]